MSNAWIAATILTSAVGVWLLTRQWVWCWLSGITTQMIWVAYAAASGQWLFIGIAMVQSVAYAMGAIGYAIHRLPDEPGWPSEEGL